MDIKSIRTTHKSGFSFLKYYIEAFLPFLILPITIWVYYWFMSYVSTKYGYFKTGFIHDIVTFYVVAIYVILFLLIYDFFYKKRRIERFKKIPDVKFLVPLPSVDVKPFSGFPGLILNIPYLIFYKDRVKIDGPTPSVSNHKPATFDLVLSDIKSLTFKVSWSFVNMYSCVIKLKDGTTYGLNALTHNKKQQIIEAFKKQAPRVSIVSA